jgi:hypothetical protein
MFGLRVLKVAFLLCSFVSFMALLPGMHSISSPRYGITFIVRHERFGWLLSLVYGVVFAAGFYGLHRRLRLAWKLGWVFLGFFYLETLTFSLISTLKLPSPDRWIASASAVIGDSIIAVYFGFWWKNWPAGRILTVSSCLRQLPFGHMIEQLTISDSG